MPTNENLNKIANVLGVETKDILSDGEKSDIVEKSFKNLNRFWFIFEISIISVCILLLLFSLVPYYKYGHYVYPIPEGQTQPEYVFGYVSILSSTLKYENPISLINVIFFVGTIIISSLTYSNLSAQTKRKIRILSVIIFLISIVLFFFSFGTMVSLVSHNDFRMNSTIIG